MPELKPPFQVICIDDANRPPEIPLNKWVKKGESYTVEKAGMTMDGQLGFVLQEIELTEDNFPYDLFAARRFGLPIEDEAEAEEAVNDLLKELETEPV